MHRDSDSGELLFDFIVPAGVSYRHTTKRDILGPGDVSGPWFLGHAVETVFVHTCEETKLELTLLLPGVGLPRRASDCERLGFDVATMWDGASELFLLGPGDFFRIQPGNAYRLRNRSNASNCKMTSTLVATKNNPAFGRDEDV